MLKCSGEEQCRKHRFGPDDGENFIKALAKLHGAFLSWQIGH